MRKLIFVLFVFVLVCGLMLAGCERSNHGKNHDKSCKSACADCQKAGGMCDKCKMAYMAKCACDKCKVQMANCAECKKAGGMCAMCMEAMKKCPDCQKNIANCPACKKIAGNCKSGCCGTK